MTKIKLCGMMAHKDIYAANELMPEYIGFVFYEKSHRNLSVKKAGELKDALDNRIKAVGVFVDADISFIDSLIDMNIIDMVQLHGNEDDSIIFHFKEKGVPVIKAFKVTDENSLRLAAHSSADYILLDAGKGEGNRFDWSLLKGFHRPYFLAGGLDAENVKAALDTLSPYAVDVSSGIETDRKKDVNKMSKFVNIVRGEK